MRSTTWRAWQVGLVCLAVSATIVDAASACRFRSRRCRCTIYVPAACEPIGDKAVEPMGEPMDDAGTEKNDAATQDNNPATDKKDYWNLPDDEPARTNPAGPADVETKPNDSPAANPQDSNPPDTTPKKPDDDDPSKTDDEVDLDKLFGVEPKPSEPSDQPEGADQPDGDPTSIDSEPPLRRWVDNTGQYQVDARVVEILDGKVRLLKANGRHCTVPFERLSPADRDYVQQLVDRVGIGAIGKVAGR